MTNVIFESHLHNIHLESNLIFRPVCVFQNRTIIRPFLQDESQKAKEKKSLFRDVYLKCLLFLAFSLYGRYSDTCFLPRLRNCDNVSSFSYFPYLENTVEFRFLEPKVVYPPPGSIKHCNFEPDFSNSPIFSNQYSFPLEVRKIGIPLYDNTAQKS